MDAVTIACSMIGARQQRKAQENAALGQMQRFRPGEWMRINADRMQNVSSQASQRCGYCDLPDCGCGAKDYRKVKS